MAEVVTERQALVEPEYRVRPPESRGTALVLKFPRLLHLPQVRDPAEPQTQFQARLPLRIRRGVLPGHWALERGALPATREHCSRSTSRLMRRPRANDQRCAAGLTLSSPHADAFAARNRFAPATRQDYLVRKLHSRIPTIPNIRRSTPAPYDRICKKQVCVNCRPAVETAIPAPPLAIQTPKRRRRAENFPVGYDS